MQFSDAYRLPHLKFTWGEISCFLRPQSMLCDELCRGHGLTFLLLYSFYRSTHRDGQFSEPVRQHFWFAQTVFRAFSGLEFRVTPLHQRTDIISSLISRLEERAPVLVPANLRYLPYYRECGRKDTPHYFIVKGFDRARGVFMVLDNVQATGDVTHTDYSSCELPVQILSKVTDAYRDTFVVDQQDARDEEKYYWFLQVAPGPEFSIQDELAVLDRLLTECLSLVRADYPDSALSLVDGRYLAVLRSAYFAKDRATLERLIRAYLKEGNLATIQFKIAIHALTCLGVSAASSLAQALDAYKSQSLLTRTKLFVRCLGPTPLTRQDWTDAEREFKRQADEFVRAFLDRTSALGRSSQLASAH